MPSPTRWIRAPWTAVFGLLIGCSPSGTSSAFTPAFDSLIASGRIDTALQHRRPAPSVTTNEGQIYQRWMDYLAHGANDPARACRPSAMWVPAEQKQWPCYDVGLLYVPLSASAEIVGIEAEPGTNRTYRVLTLFRSDTVNALRSSLTLLTVFAVRSDSGWLFAAALPRYTARWPRELVGAITYVRPPDQPFNRVRADSASHFADSLSRVFGVPAMPPLTYFVLPTIDEAYRIMGLQTLRTWGPGGGVAQPMNAMLFAADPRIGENYRHELAHVVLRPLAGSPLAFVSEAVPTWLGGTSGLSFRAAADSLAGVLASRPSVTLDSMMSGSYRAPVSYAAGAILVQLLFEQGGIDAVKNFYRSNATADGLRSAMAQVFQRPWPEVEAAWRSRALALRSSKTTK